MKMTLFAIAALAAALASSPTPAEAARAAPPPAADQARPGVPPSDSGVGGPVEPVDFRIPSILVEGRKAADESRWTGAVDPALERRYAPRQPRYNQITIEF
jgi:hypothetical protein